MPRHLFLVPALALTACAGAEPNGPEAGTFTASLTGARTESLSGVAVAGVVYTEVGVNFTIRMSVAEANDTDLFLTIECPGTEAPAPGTHAIAAAPPECTASYARVGFGPVEFETVELARATDGSFNMALAESGGVEGTFTFEGPLVVDEDTVGNLAASGRYHATVTGGGLARSPGPMVGPMSP